MNEDFARLFDAPNDWPVSLAQTKVFGINPFFAANAPDERLKRVFSFFAARRIATNVGLQSLPVEGCGKGVEGLIQQPDQPGKIMSRLKQLGLNVDYVSLDEPLTYGHIHKRDRACRYSVREVARRLAGTIRQVRAVYPKVKFVEYEAITDLPVVEWVPVLREWLDAYRDETGTELDAFAMDSDWRKPWREAAFPTAKLLHQHGTKAGHFLDATGGPTVTDESWIADAKLNIRAVDEARIPLDFVIIASWMLHPWRLLPESDPLTLTHVIDWYVRSREGGTRLNPSR